MPPGGVIAVPHARPKGMCISPGRTASTRRSVVFGRYRWRTVHWVGKPITDVGHDLLRDPVYASCSTKCPRTRVPERAPGCSIFWRRARVASTYLARGQPAGRREAALQPRVTLECRVAKPQRPRCLARLGWRSRCRLELTGDDAAGQLSPRAATGRASMRIITVRLRQTRSAVVSWTTHPDAAPFSRIAR